MIITKGYGGIPESQRYMIDATAGDTIRQRIMDVLDTRLKTILIVNGYKTNIGQNVLQWKEDSIETSKMPCIAYKDMSEKVQELTVGLQEVTLTVKLGIFFKADTALESIRKSLADISRCLLNDLTMSGLAEDVNTIASNETRVEYSGDHISEVSMDIEIIYTCDRFDLVTSGCKCSELTIVDEDGTPATDTILRNGQLDFKTTGDCCGGIVWSVSVDAGSQLGCSTITQAGVLTAGATAGGSLKVTATCATCGTSDTQYVRVTDAGTGQWCWISLDAQYCEQWDFPQSCGVIVGDTMTVYTHGGYARSSRCPWIPASCWAGGGEWISHIDTYKWKCTC